MHLNLLLIESRCNTTLTKSAFFYLKFTEMFKFSEEGFNKQINKGIVYFYDDLLRSKLPFLWNGKYTAGKQVKVIPEEILMNLHFWELTESGKWFIKGNTKLVRTHCFPPSVQHFLLLLALIAVRLSELHFQSYRNFFKVAVTGRKYLTLGNYNIYSFHSMLHSLLHSSKLCKRR